MADQPILQTLDAQDGLFLAKKGKSEDGISFEETQSGKEKTENGYSGKYQFPIE